MTNPDFDERLVEYLEKIRIIEEADEVGDERLD